MSTVNWAFGRVLASSRGITEKGRRIFTPGQMDCHVAWMGGYVALGDILCEALVSSISGQRRQRMLETTNRMTSVAKESLADPWCDRLAKG